MIEEINRQNTSQLKAQVSSLTVLLRQWADKLNYQVRCSKYVIMLSKELDHTILDQKGFQDATNNTYKQLERFGLL